MIRGEKREIVHPVNATINAAIHNRFDVEVVDAASGEVKQKAVGYNVICSGLWSRLFTASDASYFNYIQYGGGSGTPSASDTSLFGYIGGAGVVSSDDQENLDRINGVYSYRRKIQLSPETAVGSTITEVGIAYASVPSGGLVTHAMLQDMNGNPISITKTATDIINIYATVYVHFPPNGWDNGHIFIAYGTAWFRILTGTRSNYGINPSYACYTVGGGRGTYIHSSGSSTINYPNYTGRTSNSTDPSSKTGTTVFVRLSVSSMNFTRGIRGVHFTADSVNAFIESSAFIITVGGSTFPGTQINGEAIGTGDGVTKDFATDFHMVSNPTIYVNGVADSGVTVDENQAYDTTDGYGFGFELNSITEDGSPTFYHLPVYRIAASPYGDFYYENPLYQSCGIMKIGLRNGGTNCSVYASNDLNSWVLINEWTSSSWSRFTVPDQYQHYRYWKFSGSYVGANITSTASENNIHFTTPPAEGAVITADYFTKTIAKDENHVFDLTVTIQLGEYSEG